MNNRCKCGGLRHKCDMQEIETLRARISQLEADLKGQVAAKHQLGLIASQYRDGLLKETAA